MKRWLVAAVVLLSGIAIGQELRIKGHVIGESLSDFLATEPAVSKNFAKCRAKRSASIECAGFNQLQLHGWTGVSGKEPGPVWEIDGDTLSGVTLYSSGDYEQARNDISARLNTKPVETETAVQNGYGATWNERRAVWITDHYFASIEENGNPASMYRMFLRIETTAGHAAMLARTSKKPSPLD